MDDLIPLYKELAADGSNFYGLSVLQHRHSIRSAVVGMRCKTLLDYGCGRGDAYGKAYKMHRFFNMRREDVRLYDPAFPPPLAVPPTGKFDAVICSDVLEHVEEKDVPAFVARLFSHANKIVWASVCCRPAKKLFRDGRNMHVTVKPFVWWQGQFKQAAGRIPFILIETP